MNSSIISEETARRLCDLLEQAIELIQQNLAVHGDSHIDDLSQVMRLALAAVPEELTISSEIINRLIEHPLIKEKSQPGNERQVISGLLSRLTQMGYVGIQGKGSSTRRFRTELGKKALKKSDRFINVLEQQTQPAVCSSNGSTTEVSEKPAPVAQPAIPEKAALLTTVQPEMPSSGQVDKPTIMVPLDHQQSDHPLTSQQRELLEVLCALVETSGSTGGVHVNYLADRLVGNKVYNPEGQEFVQILKRITPDMKVLVELGFGRKSGVHCTVTAKGYELLGQCQTKLTSDRPTAPAPKPVKPASVVKPTSMSQSDRDRLSSLVSKLSMAKDVVARKQLFPDSQRSHQDWDDIVKRLLENNGGRLTFEEASKHLKRQARVLGFDPQFLSELQIQNSLTRTFERIGKEARIKLDSSTHTLTKVR